MNRNSAFLAPVAMLGIALASPAQAVEGATNFYLLGSKTTMAGYLPPAGTYGILSNYFYSGDADIRIETAGVELSGGVEADAYVALPTALWVLEQKVMGGNLAFSLTTPFGGKSVEAGLITGRTETELGFERENWAFGDPVLGTTLGWHDGNMHYTLGALVNVPVGQWELGNPVNIGFNRWVLDTTGAVTYLNPTTGVELSGAAGFTFNFVNPDTNYDSGTEVHLEAAGMMHLSKTFSAGINGYAYKQVTDDSGEGALLGGFKGQVLAIGPAVDYSFTWGSTHVATNFRYFHEFDVENRLRGHAAFVNVAIPLGGKAE